MAEIRSASPGFRQIDVLDSSFGLQDVTPFNSRGIVLLVDTKNKGPTPRKLRANHGNREHDVREASHIH